MTSSDLHSVSSSSSLRLDTDSAISSTLEADNAVSSCDASQALPTSNTVGEVSVTDGIGKLEGLSRSSNLSSVSEDFSLKSSSPGSFPCYLILLFSTDL